MNLCQGNVHATALVACDGIGFDVVLDCSNFDGEVPPLETPSDADQELLDTIAETPDTVGEAYESYRMREAVAETMELARAGNKYFNDTEPWHTRTSDPQACANTVHVCLQVCAALSILMDPVVPHATARLRNMLNLTNVRTSTPDPNPAPRGWHEAGTALLEPGHLLNDPVILFDKLDDDRMDAQRNKLGTDDADTTDSEPTLEEQGYESPKDAIEFGDFMDLDLRVGEITHAEPVEDADKLLRLEVDLGYEERQILAGIAQHMEPEAIIGKRVTVVANLAPKTMFGLESQGMVLMGEDRDGNLSLLTTDAEPGSVVR